MATIQTNIVSDPYGEYFVLTYTFASSKFTWSVTPYSNSSPYRTNIYGLMVNVGGNSYYKGDIAWGDYTPGSAVYSGTTNLSDCTVSGGAVTLSVSGNFYYGTWDSSHRASGSGTCAVDPPTVSALTYTATNKYSNMVVSGRSVITFTMRGTSQTGSSTITYNLFQDGSAISTTTGTSGSNKTVQVTAPSAGSHSYYYRATDGNGTTSTSGSISITTYAYTQPSFNSISAVRWLNNTASGGASDEGKYCKATASWNVGKVGTTNLTTTLKVTVSSYTGTATTSGAILYLGNDDLSPDNSYTVTFALYDNYTGEANAVKRTDTLTMGGRGLDFIYQNGHYGVAVGQKAVANQFNVNMDTILESNVYVHSASGYRRLLVGSTDTSGDHVLEVDGQAGRMQLYAGSSYKGLWIGEHGTGVQKYPIVITTNNYTTMEMEQINLRSSHTSSNSTLIIQNASSLVTNAFTRSSGWTINSQKVYKWGRVITASITLNASSSVSSGSNAFVGTLASGYRPLVNVSASSYYASAVMTAILKTDGTITVRVGGSGSAGASGDTETFTWTYVI